jgi:hypothetical protein
MRLLKKPCCRTLSAAQSQSGWWRDGRPRPSTRLGRGTKEDAVSPNGYAQTAFSDGLSHVLSADARTKDRCCHSSLDKMIYARW